MSATSFPESWPLAVEGLSSANNQLLAELQGSVSDLKHVLELQLKEIEAFAIQR